MRRDAVNSPGVERRSKRPRRYAEGVRQEVLRLHDGGNCKPAIKDMPSPHQETYSRPM